MKTYELTAEMGFALNDYDPRGNYQGSWSDKNFNYFKKNVGITDNSSKEEVIIEYFEKYFNRGMANQMIISNITIGQKHPLFEVYPEIKSADIQAHVVNGNIPKFVVKLWKGKKGSLQLKIVRMITGKYIPPGNKQSFLLKVPNIEIYEKMDPWDNSINVNDAYILKNIPSRRLELKKRANEWEEYLDFTINNIKDKQWGCKIDKFKELNLDRGTVICSFVMNPASLRRGTSLMVVNQSDSLDKNKWKADLKARNPNFLIRKLGKCHTFKEGTKEIKIELDQDLLSKGYSEVQLYNILSEFGGHFMVNEIIRELAVYLVQRNALRKLIETGGANQYLGDFLFNYSAVGAGQDYNSYNLEREPAEDLNKDQKISLLKILSNQHVTLIQGPPGTGKTTLIAELARQAAFKGQRVLIASQTNMAVDNAISRLHNVKEILPIRLGSVDRVTEDGQDFVEENVVNTWFKSVEDSMNNIVADEQQVIEIADLIVSQSKTENELKNQIENTLNENIKKLIKEKKAYEREIKKISLTINEKDLEIDNIQNEINTMRKLSEMELTLKSLTAKDLNVDEVALEMTINVIQNPKLRESMISLSKFLEKVQEYLRFQDMSDEDTTIYNELRYSRMELIEEGEDTKSINKKITDIEKKYKPKAWIGLMDNIKDIMELLPVNDRTLSKQIDKLIGSLYPSHTHEKVVNKLLLLLTNIENAVVTVEKIIVEQGENKKKEREIFLDELMEKYDKLKDNALKLQNDRRVQENKVKDITTRIEMLEDEKTKLLETIHSEKMNILEKIGSKDIKGFSEIVELWKNEHLEILAGESKKWIPIRDEWLKRIKKRTNKDVESIRDTYVKVANVVGATCYYTGRKKFYEEYGEFDYVVIDEVSKATAPELLMPMLLGNKVVLVGDHRQLPPMYRERISFGDEQDEGTEKDHKLAKETSRRYAGLVTSSYFKEAWENAPETNRHRLKEQYRMHSQIMRQVNHFYSDGPLKMGLPNQDELKNHGLKVKNLFGENNHIIWLDSGYLAPEVRNYAEQHNGSKSRYNKYEIKLITKIFEDLNQVSEEVLNVGVITYYGDHVKMLRKVITPMNNNLNQLKIRYGTVDRFQGAERDIIIISLVGSVKGKPVTGFTKDFRRINVGISRAKTLLIIVGSKKDFEKTMINVSDVVDKNRKKQIYGKIINEIKTEFNGYRRGFDYIGPIKVIDLVSIGADTNNDNKVINKKSRDKRKKKRRKKK